MAATANYDATGAQAQYQVWASPKTATGYTNMMCQKAGSQTAQGQVKSSTTDLNDVAGRASARWGGGTAVAGWTAVADWEASTSDNWKMLKCATAVTFEAGASAATGLKVGDKVEFSAGAAQYANPTATTAALSTSKPEALFSYTIQDSAIALAVSVAAVASATSTQMF